MKKCDCYHEHPNNHRSAYGDVGICYGTKEREPCSCGGDIAKCNFYPEKRKYTCESYNGQDGWCSERNGPCICPVDGDRSKYTVDDGMTAKLHRMNTAEMWLEAQKTGAYYECINANIAYSKELGLVEKDDHNHTWSLANWDINYGRSALDALIVECAWEKTVMPISIAEAEKFLGRRIIINNKVDATETLKRSDKSV